MKLINHTLIVLISVLLLSSCHQDELIGSSTIFDKNFADPSTFKPYPFETKSKTNEDIFHSSFYTADLRFASKTGLVLMMGWSNEYKGEVWVKISGNNKSLTKHYNREPGYFPIYELDFSMPYNKWYTIEYSLDGVNWVIYKEVKRVSFEQVEYRSFDTPHTGK